MLKHTVEMLEIQVLLLQIPFNPCLNINAQDNATTANILGKRVWLRNF
jgi:hypothetical protein